MTREALANYRDLVERTVEVFGDPLKASRWLSSPTADLGGQTPIEVARKSAYDVSTIEPVLTRIEHGVYF